jgi:hypothetical protein
MLSIQYRFDKGRKDEDLMKKIQGAVLMFCFLSFSILTQSCALPGIMQNSSKFENLSIDRHYEE